VTDNTAPISPRERQWFVLCEKCHREPVERMENRPTEVVLICTKCQHVWTVKRYDV
jgi:hypothetical protein